MKEQLIIEINNKDLGNVKALVEDNCLMSHIIVTAVLEESNKTIRAYLSEKFPAIKTTRSSELETIRRERANKSITPRSTGKNKRN